MILGVVLFSFGCSVAFLARDYPGLTTYFEVVQVLSTAGALFHIGNSFGNLVLRGVLRFLSLCP